MKIVLVCSSGGHLTEMYHLLPAFEGHEIIFVTYESERTKIMTQRKYLLRNIGRNPLRMAFSFLAFMRILGREKPNLVVSTGSEIAIPALYVSRLLGIKTVYIESWCRVVEPSGTGRFVYRVADLFLVQWPQLLDRYGKRAKYEGGIL